MCNNAAVSIGVQNPPPENLQPRSPEQQSRLTAGKKDLALILPGRIVQFALALATLRIASHLLDPAEMGRMSMFTAIAAFFALAVVNPVGMFLNRHLHRWNLESVITQRLRHHTKYLL